MSYHLMLQIVDKSGVAHFQVEYKEKCMVVSPSEIITHIYKNLLGMLFIFICYENC